MTIEMGVQTDPCLFTWRNQDNFRFLSCKLTNKQESLEREGKGKNKRFRRTFKGRHQGNEDFSKNQYSKKWKEEAIQTRTEGVHE